jgi:hypothetical protein
MLYPSENDRADVVTEMSNGDETHGMILHTPQINLDGGAGV